MSAAAWSQFLMKSCCLQTLPTCTRILALIVAFDIAASPQRVWDCSHSEKSLSFRDSKS